MHGVVYDVQDVHVYVIMFKYILDVPKNNGKVRTHVRHGTRHAPAGTDMMWCRLQKHGWVTDASCETEEEQWFRV